MAFFNKIFSGIGISASPSLVGGNLKTAKKGNTVKKIPIVLVDEKAAKEKVEREKLEKDLAELVQKSTIFAEEYEGKINEILKVKKLAEKKLLEVEEKVNPIFVELWSFVGRYEEGEKTQAVLTGIQACLKKANDFLLELSEAKSEVPKKSAKETQPAEKKSILNLKTLAEQIRHRVHYIDKNDFAKKAVSSKDKVYDYDLRRDLAYFLANERFSAGASVETEGEDDQNYFQTFEMLITKAANNEKIGYVVYGEKTYVVEHEAMRDTKHGTRSMGKGIKNTKPEIQNTKHKTQSVEPASEEEVAGLPKRIVEIFRKSGVEFVENLKKESQADSVGLITDEERIALLKIFTKRFLREMIAEKKQTLQKKMAFDVKRSEELVEFVCDFIFKKN